MLERIIRGGKMATRPIYISTGDVNNPFTEDNINFEWKAGYSYVNKCKRRDNLKKEIAKKYDIDNSCVFSFFDAFLIAFISA